MTILASVGRPRPRSSAPSSATKWPRSVESLRLATVKSIPVAAPAAERLEATSPTLAAASVSGRLRVLVSTKKQGRGSASAAASDDTDQSASTSKPCTVCVPVGSSSSTTIFARLAPTSCRTCAKSSPFAGAGRESRMERFIDGTCRDGGGKAASWRGHLRSKVPSQAQHRPNRVQPRVHAVHAAVRDMLEIRANRAAQAVLGQEPHACVRQPVEVEVLALRPLDLVPLAVEPADTAAGREEQGAGAALVPPFQDSRGRAAYEMVLGPHGYGLDQQAEPVADHQVPAEEFADRADQGALYRQNLRQHRVAQRRRVAREAPDEAALVVEFPVLDGVIRGLRRPVAFRERERDARHRDAKSR